MLGLAIPPNMLPAMLRPISLLVVALACGFCTSPAAAQMSQSDLLTRLDRLEATIRDLAGTVEQLQYRNQQLEQQVQRLQTQMQGGVTPSASAASPPQLQRPAAPYSPPLAAPPAPIIAAEPPPAPVAPGPASSGRGDAFNPAVNPTAPGAPRPLGTSTTATEPPPVADTPGRPASAGRATRSLDLVGIARRSAAER